MVNQTNGKLNNKTQQTQGLLHAYVILRTLI